MNEPDEQQDAVAEAMPLIVSYFDGTLTPELALRLQDLVCRYPEVASLHVAVAHQCCTLKYCFPSDETNEFAPPRNQKINVQGIPQFPIVLPTSSPPMPHRQRLSRRAVISLGFAIAAIILLTLGVPYLLLSGGGDVTLASEVKAVWETPVNRGDKLSGSWYSLLQGHALLKYRSGVISVIEAPARFRILKHNGIELNSGKLTAEVPSAAKGFSVQTKNYLVTDYGTEFGVKVSPDQETLVDVFKGKIGLRLIDQSSGSESFVKAGEAVVIRSDSNQPLAVPENKFLFTRHPDFESRLTELQLPSSQRWRSYGLDLRRDPGLILNFDFDLKDGTGGDFTNKAVTGQLLNGKFVSEVAASLATVQGRWPDKGARKFESRFLQSISVQSSPLLDFSRNGTSGLSFSIMFWVNMDVDQPIDASIVTRGIGLKEQYSVGVQKGNFRAWVRTLARSGSTETANAKGPQVMQGWHQVVMTLDSNAKTLLLYVDGSASGSAQLNGPLIAADDGPLLIGSRLGSVTKHLPSFNGAIDELAIFKRALTAAEINAWFQLGKRD